MSDDILFLIKWFTRDKKEVINKVYRTKQFILLLNRLYFFIKIVQA
jgi:hypothetical protein